MKQRLYLFTYEWKTARAMSLSTLLSAILLLLQTERTLATQQSAMNIEPSLLHPHDDVTSITHTTSSAFLRPRLLLPPRGTSAQLFRGKVSRVSDLLRPSPLKMRDVRDVQPKDDDALKVAENSTNMVTAKVAYEVARPTELGTTVDLPSGQAPLDLPQVQLLLLCFVNIMCPVLRVASIV